MDSPLENPVIRYGMGLGSAVVLVIVAFGFLDGTMRWLLLGLAGVEIVVVPQVMKMATN